MSRFYFSFSVQVLFPSTPEIYKVVAVFFSSSKVVRFLPSSMSLLFVRWVFRYGRCHGTYIFPASGVRSITTRMQVLYTGGLFLLVRNLPRIRHRSRPPYIYGRRILLADSLLYRNALMDGSKRGYANLCVLAACPRRESRDGIGIEKGYLPPLPLGHARDANTRTLAMISTPRPSSRDFDLLLELVASLRFG